jgi:hypothetical protein
MSVKITQCYISGRKDYFEFRKNVVQIFFQRTSDGPSAKKNGRCANIKFINAPLKNFIKTITLLPGNIIDKVRSPRPDGFKI